MGTTDGADSGGSDNEETLGPLLLLFFSLDVALQARGGSG
jgi:hypothetical protein